MASDTFSSSAGSASPTGATASSGSTGSTASASKAGTTGGHDREDLEAQIARLREDVSGVTETLKNLASDRATGARDQAYAIRDDVKHRGERYMQQAQEAANDLEEQLSDQIRDEPIKSVLIAVAIGYLYARIFH